MKKLLLIGIVLFLSLTTYIGFTNFIDERVYLKIDGQYISIGYNKLKNFRQKEDFQIQFKNIDFDGILLISLSPVLSDVKTTTVQVPIAETGYKEITGIPTVFKVEPGTKSKSIGINPDFLDNEIKSPVSKLSNWKVDVYLLKELAVRPVIKPKLLLGHKIITPDDLPNNPVILSDTIEKAAFQSWPLENPDFLDISDSNYGYFLYYHKDKLLEKVHFNLK